MYLKEVNYLFIYYFASDIIDSLAIIILEHGIVDYFSQTTEYRNN